MGYLDDYFDNSYYGVCLNCGSGKCGYHGGCTDRETDNNINIKNEVTENGE
jgi:adenine specific DNA methylase Mod